MRAVDRQREERLERARRRVEIAERLEERHDLHAGGAARPAGQQQHGEQIRRPARHRDDEGPERRAAVDGLGAGEEAEEPPRLGRQLVERESGDLRGLGRLLGEEAEQHGRAGRLVALGEAGLEAQAGQDVAERGGEPSRVFPDVEARRVQAEALDLVLERAHPVAGERGRDALGDQVHHRADLGGGDARGVRRLVEEARRHVLARGRLQIGGEQGQRQAIGLARVALLEIGHVRGQGTARVEPGGQRLGRRAAPAAHAQAAGQVLHGAAMPLHREAAMQAQGLGGQFGHHRGVAVAVAADPRRQREPRGRRDQARVVARDRGLQIGVDPRHEIPEDLVHEVEAGAHLVGDRGPGGARAVGQPERGDLGLEPGQQLASAPAAAGP